MEDDDQDVQVGTDEETEQVGPPAFAPLTAEGLDDQIHRAQWMIEIQVTKTMLAEEQRRMADATVPLASGIAPSSQHGTLRNTIRQCEDRITRLRSVMLLLGAEENVPLPRPSDLLMPPPGLAIAGRH